MITEHLEQTAAVYVVTAIKDSHVTWRRGRVLRDVTMDTKGSIATKVRYLLASILLLFHKDLNNIWLT